MRRTEGEEEEEEEEEEDWRDRYLEGGITSSVGRLLVGTSLKKQPGTVYICG